MKHFHIKIGVGGRRVEKTKCLLLSQPIQADERRRSKQLRDSELTFAKQQIINVSGNLLPCMIHVALKA